jgi:hypothetical protein
MQKALQNPHYNKIWEKVMMNRHPEVKSLEDALKMEAYQDGCLFYNTKENMYGLNLAHDTVVRYTPTRGNYEICGRLNTEFAYLDQDEPYDWQYGYNFEILGRPITLEDILILLKGYFAGIHVDINGIFKLNGIGQPADWSIIGWNFTKPLHEQTSQVWENISKLIG